MTDPTVLSRHVVSTLLAAGLDANEDALDAAEKRIAEREAGLRSIRGLCEVLRPRGAISGYTSIINNVDELLPDGEILQRRLAETS